MNRSKERLDGARSLIRAVEGGFEIAMLTVCYYLIWRGGYGPGVFPVSFGLGNTILTLIYSLLVLVLLRSFDGFKFGYLKLSDVLVSQWIAMMIVNFITYLQLCLFAGSMISPVSMLVLMGVDMIVTLVCCGAYTRLYHRLYTPRNMIMIYGRDDSVVLKFKMDARSDKYHISRVLSGEEGLEAICREIVNYDGVILNDVPAPLRNDVLKFCYRNRIRTYLTPKLSDIITRGATEITLFDTPLLLVKGGGIPPVQRMAKRAMDIVGCLLVLTIAAPVMLATAAAIKLEDGGPIFYRQKRATLGGKVFTILKFRSMIVEAEKDGRAAPAAEHDPRITKVGRVIRAARIDELPQLLNILRGEMSIVGPRPERVEHVTSYSAQIPEFDFRLKVRGGLTGYAQIYGKYNTSPYDKLRLDLMYIENYSLLLDIKLILMTIRVMLKKESTEGFDRAEELMRRKEEILRHSTHPPEEAREPAAMC